MVAPVPDGGQVRPVTAILAAQCDTVGVAAALVHAVASSRGRLDGDVYRAALRDLCECIPGLDRAAATTAVSLAYLGAVARRPDLFWHDGRASAV